MTGRFCPNCGIEAPSAAGSFVPRGTPASFQAPGLTQNVASALCYLFGFITGIIFLVISPYNKDRTVRFHAFQSIFLTVGLFVIDIILVVLSGALYAAYAGPLVQVIWLIYRVGVFVGWLFLMYSAYNNKKVIIPIVGPLAAKQA